MSCGVRVVLAAGAVLLAAAAASAHGHGRPVYATAAYYYPGYYYYAAPLPAALAYPAPVYPAPAALPCPVPAIPVAPPAFAQPTPAPPSGPPVPQTTEPPFKGGPPKVTESRSAAGKATFSSDGIKDATCCRVGFWNVSGRDVTLTVDGQARLLANNQALSLRLGRRHFTWQIDRRSPHAEDVPADKTAVEIVIRN